MAGTDELMIDGEGMTDMILSSGWLQGLKAQLTGESPIAKVGNADAGVFHSVKPILAATITIAWVTSILRPL